jgi:hypothetical protein
MADETAAELAARIVRFTLRASRDPRYAVTHAGEAAAAMASAALLLATKPDLAKLLPIDAAKQVQAMGSQHLFGTKSTPWTEGPMAQGDSESGTLGNMSPGVRGLYNRLLKDDPKQARAFLIQARLSSLKFMSEILSNVSKTRAEIGMTFARNARS